ncbi:hypothetical protein [Lewinella cohaerens]|uniref:hypothetical protein n=1 Tax=Lewinella cohaerens TaxID=70995 RepID=UPI000374FAD3|nr:hypothetical protein [Lewinella cohaerens]
MHIPTRINLQNLKKIDKYLKDAEYHKALNELRILMGAVALNKVKKTKYEKELVRISQDFEKTNNVSDWIKDYAYSLYELFTELRNMVLDDRVYKASKGIVELKPDEALELVQELLPESQWMKVVGAGRQHVAESGNHKTVLNYYSAIEKKLGETTTRIPRPFYIRRVTQHQLEKRFREHLERCLTIVDENANRYEIVHYGNLKITNTYYILRQEDNTEYLFVTLNVDQGIDLIDNALVFYTTNNRIVTNYNRHFDQFWNNEGRSGRVIKSLSDFKKYIPFDSDLYEKYTALKNFIKRVPNDSIRMRHLKSEVSSAYSRLEGLNSCTITYEHTSKNIEILKWFNEYMQELDGSKTYLTVSIFKFWETIGDYKDFLDRQQQALSKGARIRRIFFVDSSGLRRDFGEAYNVDEYNARMKMQQEVIYENYQQSLLYKNYDFKVLFSSRSKESAARDNFAIWINEPIDYKILFKMNYGFPSAYTEITFANYSDEDVSHINHSLVQSYVDHFDRMMRRVQSENNQLLTYLSNEEIDDYEFKNICQERIDFLRGCRIEDIEGLLSEEE